MTDMLVEFETLDRDDVLEIINGKWDIEKKRKRLKSAEDLQRKLPPLPPEPIKVDQLPITDDASPQQI